MFAQKLTITTAQLNAATNQTRTINASAEPKSIKINNNTGASLSYIIFTASEFEMWDANNALSDFVDIASGSTDIINDLPQETTTMIILGTTGHTGNLDSYILKENR